METQNSGEFTQTEHILIGNKFDLHFIPTNHDVPNFLADHESDLKHSLSQMNAFIMEYWPDEIRKLQNNPLVERTTNYSEILPFSDELRGIIQNYDKPVFIFDPAHNESFAKVRFWGAAPAGAGLIEVVSAVFDKKTNRRKFLFGAGLSSAALSSLSTIPVNKEYYDHKAYNWLNEGSFRRVIIAQGIVSMSKRMDSNPNINYSKFGLLYPEVHIQGIKELILDEAKRNLLLNAFTLVAPWNMLDTNLTQGRIYQFKPQINEWQKTSTFSCLM